MAEPLAASRLAILGLGLLSGSLAAALRQRGWPGHIAAWGPRPASLECGLAMGVVDSISLDLAAVIDGADIIVVGAPPIATGTLLAELLVHPRVVEQQPVVTDLASIKGHVIAAAGSDYPGFVPGHPIAGSEHSGVAAADADLFAGREVILTPLPATDPVALDAVRRLWLATGARVTEMAVAAHDAALAASSHSPHMVAYALTMALEHDDLQPMKHGGGALRDMTRIAGSDPLMWRDIALTNRAALLTALDGFSAELGTLRGLIDRADGEALSAYFAACRKVRRDHDAVLNPLPVNLENSGQ